MLAISEFTEENGATRVIPGAIYGMTSVCLLKKKLSLQK